MAAPGIKVVVGLTSKLLRRARYAPRTIARRPVADFGRRPNAPRLREAYRRSNEQAQERYKREFYQRYQRERGLLLEQPNIPQQPREPIPVPTQLPRRISDPRLARRKPRMPSASSQSQLERLPRYQDFPEPPAPRLPLNIQRPPVSPRPPRTLLRRYLDTSRKINDKLTQVNRGLNDIAFPGLNEVSDFLSDQVIRFIKEQRRNWRRVRNILEESRENPQIPPTNPEPNFTLPIDPQWRDTDEITVIYGGTSFINDDGWQWLPTAPLSSLPPHWGVIDDYALITIQDRTRMINASLLFDSNFEDPPLYYLYTSFTFSVGNLRTVNGRVDRLARVTNSIDEPCTPIDVITPSGSWSPDFEPSPPLEQEFEIVPRINRRLRRIIEEREERERMSCDLSPIMVALRRIIATNVNLPAQVTQTHLQINANIDELKPPFATINATTQATSTTVNSVDNVVNNTATRVQNIASKLDDVGNLVQRTFDKVGEVFQEITKRIDKWSKWFRLPMLLDALSFILLLHNAAMLSANVVQTVG